MLSIVVAIAEDNAIGKSGGLLCHLPNDLKHFKEITLGSTVLMGLQTYFSLPKRPLPKRRNIVITTKTDFEQEGIEVAHSIEEALSLVQNEKEAFIIGGGSIYKQMLPYAGKLYITHIHHKWDDADTFFPEININEWKQQNNEEHLVDEKNPYPYSFAEYTRTSKL